MQKYQSVLELMRLKKRSDIEEAFSIHSNINFDTFYSSLASKLSLNLSEKDIRRLFYQIDPYCKESISYKSIIDYLENYESCRMSTEEPYHPIPSIFSGVRVQDNIFEWVVYPEQQDSRLDVAGNYISLSHSGLLSFWKRDFTKHFEATISVADDGANMIPMATGLVCLPKYKMIAVSTTAADIRFFNCSTYKFQHKFSIIWMPAVILNMDCYNSEKLICGDFRGCVLILQMESSFFKRIHRMADHLDPLNIPFDELGKERAAGLNGEFTSKSHSSNVIKVKYIPSLRAIISCSVNTKRAMLIHNLEQKRSISFSSEGGISCLDFCEKMNCVATGCIDNSIKIWNPSVNRSCSEKLSGHLSSVTHILVDEERLLIISADRERTVRIWDFLRPKCLQIIKFKKADLGKRNFASLYLDSENGKLIITTNRVAVLNAHRSGTISKAHLDSELLVYVAYNSIFNCIITVGNKSSFALWDPESCLLIYEHKEAHVTTDREGIIHVWDITAAGLDLSERRLITAGSDGKIKVWNFHLGICLREFKANFSVLTITFVGFAIYAAGSSGSISIFYDNDQDTIEEAEWMTSHERAIISLCCYSSTLLASASSDGQIVIWLRKNAEAKLYLKDLTLQEEFQDDRHYTCKHEMNKLRKCSISQILFLQTREMDSFVGNLVSCGSDGRIRFWNVICANKINKWRMVSKFRAVFGDLDGVLSMVSDFKNTYLFTGDTMGYIRVYDLEDYYSSYGSEPANSLQLKRRHFDQFPFLRLQQLIEKKHGQSSKFPQDGGAEFGYSPLLLNCFLAHIGPVLKIAYSNEKEFLISVTRKGSVRKWTVAGAFLGSLETTGNADIQRNMTSASHLPSDIRRVASPLTLHVLNRGKKPHWERVMKALKHCHLGHVQEPTKEIPFCWMQKKTDAIEKDLSKKFTLIEDLEKRLRERTIAQKKTKHKCVTYNVKI